MARQNARRTFQKSKWRENSSNVSAIKMAGNGANVANVSRIKWRENLDVSRIKMAGKIVFKMAGMINKNDGEMLRTFQI